jgi:hypothetical protein
MKVMSIHQNISSLAHQRERKVDQANTCSAAFWRITTVTSVLPQPHRRHTTRPESLTCGPA